MWINPTTQQVFTTHSEIRFAFPNVSMPANLNDEIIESLGFLSVVATPPGHDPMTHTATQDAPALLDGVWTQQWVIAPLSAEAIAAKTEAARLIERARLKSVRAIAVAAITVTTQAGNTFDGDEDSQTRMARAIIALSTGLAPSVNWVLADNSVIAATGSELTEALVLAGMAQAALWVIPE